MTWAASPNRVGGARAGRITMGARREVLGAVAERYRSASRAEKGRILDELCATTGWHCKHTVRALSARIAGRVANEGESRQRRRRGYDGGALWEASDRVCGKRLVVMIPALLPALERHGRVRLDKSERALVLSVSAATIDRMLVDVKIAAVGARPHDPRHRSQDGGRGRGAPGQGRYGRAQQQRQVGPKVYGTVWRARSVATSSAPACPPEGSSA